MASKEFEIARLLMLQAAAGGHLSDSTAFAWSRRMFPSLCDSEIAEAFEADFIISKQQIETVLEFLDTEWSAGNAPTYYSLENRFGGRSDEGIVTRSELTAILRYAFLDRRFTQEIWTALTVAGSGPVESQGLAKPFSASSEIYFD